jgi:secondary thiamine-phosphate synthase enzyme
VVSQRTITVNTRGRGSYEVTSKIKEVVAEAGIQTGLCNIFIQHTSASVILCENADPSVRTDLETFMAGLVPDGSPAFKHDMEGDDDMPAHIRTILTDSSITIPVVGGYCALGTWQGIYLWEHRTHSHSRKIIVSVYGD